MIQADSTVRVGGKVGTVDYISAGVRALVVFPGGFSVVFPLSKLVEVEDVEEPGDEDEGTEREGCAFEDPDTFADEDSRLSAFDDSDQRDPSDDDVNEGPIPYYLEAGV